MTFLTGLVPPGATESLALWRLLFRVAFLHLGALTVSCKEPKVPNINEPVSSEQAERDKFVYHSQCTPSTHTLSLPQVPMQGISAAVSGEPRHRPMQQAFNPKSSEFFCPVFEQELQLYFLKLGGLGPNWCVVTQLSPVSMLPGVQR